VVSCPSIERNLTANKAMLRYLLLKHPRLVHGVLVFVVMTAIGSFVAPLIVHNFEIGGTALAILGMFAVACLMERHGY
jgi:hypothetical protein